MGEGAEMDFPSFCACVGLCCLSCLHRGRLTAPVCDLIGTQQKEEEAALKQARDKSDLVATAAAAGVAKRRHKAPWTLPLESH